MYSFVYECERTCACSCMCEYMCMCDGQKSVSGIIPIVLFTWFGDSLSLSQSSLIRLGLLNTKHQASTSVFLPSVWMANMHPHACS